MKKVLALVLALALLGTGSAWAESPAATLPTLTFSENPTTGYTWGFASSDEAILAVADGGYTPLPNADSAEGRGGTHTWTLTGIAAGEAEATFTLRQDWDGGEVLDTLVYTCQVGADLSVTVAQVAGIPEQYMPDKAVVLLLENPTTGFTWAYQASTEGILTLDQDTFIAPTGDQDGQAAVGAGGYHLWVFSGAAEGDVTLTFGYARSWETGVVPEATVTYGIHVDSALQVSLVEIDGDFAQYDVLMAGAGA